MKRILIRALSLFFIIGIAYFCFHAYIKHKYNCDLAVMGTLRFGDGIGRQAIGLIDSLHDNYSIKYIHHGYIDLQDLPEKVKKIVQQKYKSNAHVLIFEDPLLFPSAARFSALGHADVKIAYSMFESTKIPKNWQKILNREFDAVIVPDEFFVKVYQDCGVKIPIFVIPLGMYLDPFITKSYLHTKPQERPFVFGNLGSFISRKNQAVLIQAFAIAFSNNPKVELILNGRYDDNDCLKLIQETKRSLGLDNVTITSLPLSWEDYVKELSSFDCYVSPSTGEGFSLQPREALALGIPSIVTDNTAQATICRSGYVKVVPSNTPVQAFYKDFQPWHDDLGLQFECDVNALANALREMYENYELHALKAYESTNWVEQYRYTQLHHLYKTIVLPKKVILGDRNVIEDGVIYTTSIKLKQNYDKVIAKQNPLRKVLNFLVMARQ